MFFPVRKPSDSRRVDVINVVPNVYPMFSDKGHLWYILTIVKLVYTSNFTMVYASNNYDLWFVIRKKQLTYG